MTTAQLGPPDVELALRQHERYQAALESCGLRVVVLDADPQHPDSTFVEDTAVLVAGTAILTVPGASSRQGEVALIRPIIEHNFSTLRQIRLPGTVDGGDICEAGSHYYIGVSSRTNEEGAEQLAALLAVEGFTSSTVDVRGLDGILHLKSGVAYLGDGRFVAIESIAALPPFRQESCVVVDASEMYAANCVRVNDAVLIADGYPALRRALDSNGYRTIALDVSEFRKMDGGLSCLSLRF